MNVLLNEEYPSAGGVSLRYDMFRPDAIESLKAIVLIHGGGWVSGDRADIHQVAQFFAENGYAACCPQYRLAPLHPYPAAVDDCQHFVGFLRDRSGSLGIEPNKIASFGNSAGGHLSTSLALREMVKGDTSCKVNAAVNIAGLMDLTDPTEKHPSISWDFINQFMGKPYAENEQLWVDASPIFHVSADDSPILILHGDEDDVVPLAQSQQLHNALTACGVESELVVLRGEGHSYTDEGFTRILSSSLAFLQRTLGNDC